MTLRLTPVEQHLRRIERLASRVGELQVPVGGSIVKACFLKIAARDVLRDMRRPVLDAAKAAA